MSVAPISDMLPHPERFYSDDHEAFRSTVRAYARRHVEPALAGWEATGLIERVAYEAAGDAGLLGLDSPAVYGGGKVKDLLLYLIDNATAEQQAKHIPGCCSGQLIGAICMRATEMQKCVVDRSLQLFGGYGCMLEYPIAQSYVDSRVATIYGGTTEIMKHVIGRDLRARVQATMGG